MINIGRVCVKIAGRDAGQKCVVLDIIDDNFVMIDGQTRRRKCNIKHLEPLNQEIDVRKGASHEAVVSAFSNIGIEIIEKKARQKTVKPVKQRGKAEKAEEGKKTKKEKKKEEKAAKKAEKKAEKK